MSRRRMNAREIKEVLRLRFFLKFSIRDISRRVNKARSSIHDLVRKAEDADLGWPLPEESGEGCCWQLSIERPAIQTNFLKINVLERYWVLDLKKCYELLCFDWRVVIAFPKGFSH